MRILKSRPTNDLTAPRTPNHGRCGGAWEPVRCPLQGPQRPRRLDDSGRPRGPGRPLSEAVGEAWCGDLVIRSPGLSRWRCRGCGSGRFSNGGEIINKVVFLLSFWNLWVPARTTHCQAPTLAPPGRSLQWYLGGESRKDGL